MPDMLHMDTLPKGCVAALALLLFLLSVSITVVRLRTKMLAGAPDDPTRLLAKLVRAQGNTAEYAAMLAVLIVMHGAAPRPAWVSTMMALAVAARVVFAAGMLLSPSLARFNIIRAVGACGTYVAGIALALALVIR
ncbi:MAPEG family protein [Xanthobacter oligotrophicus]|uniref:MAPEG family protein n=1 Tax=Xanthobacter oligotrophicus TaxID=2607286 RepID=A0ABW7A2E0_9HYPH